MKENPPVQRMELRCILDSKDISLVQELVYRLGGAIILESGSELLQKTKDNYSPKDRIIALRKSSGMTQYDLSAVTGICQTLISAMEVGTNRITRKSANKLGKAFNVSPNVFFTIKE